MPSIADMLSPVIRFYLSRLGKNSLPKTNGTIKVDGLAGKVEIIRDKWGVPHFYGAALSDIIFAQGFVHAQERLFQMEMGRRLASGTMSELLGPDLLDVDRIMRTVGIRDAGIKDLELLNKQPEIPSLYQRFADGINHYIDSCGKNLPMEFKLLKTTPDPWLVEDSMAIGKLVGFQMSYGWLIEIEKQRIADAVGPEKAAELDIHYPENNPVILPEGIETFAYADDGRLRAFSGPYLKPFGGSNNWTVSPFRTKDGSAYLCNDPHLPVTLPSIWIENHLVCNDMEVTGVTIPGLPFILIGHNRHIAWGSTLAFTDVQDSFVETFTDDTLETYLFEGKAKKAIHHKEEIRVKGWDKPHIENVISTHHGPVISDILDFPEKKISLQSTALMPSSQVIGFYKLNKAKNWDDFVEAMTYVDSPPLNIVYADTDNNIGYWVTGKVPVRKANNFNYLPKDGSSGAFEWEGYVPFEEMPHAYNPKTGYLATCNNKITGDNYPHFLGNLWMNGYRRNRLATLFGDKTNLDAADFAKFQTDFFSIPGTEFKLFYKNRESANSLEKQAIEALTTWDGNLTTNSVGGCIYQVIKKEMIDFVIGDRISELSKNRFKGSASKAMALPLSEYFGHDTTAMLRILKNEKSWWNIEAGGTENILNMSLENAVKWLTKTLGPNIKDWEWGKLHTILFKHPFAEKPPLGKILNAGEFPLPGDTDTVCQMAFIPDHPYGGAVIAPSYRQIINMQDFDASVTVLPPGQSGNHLSANYDDQIELWLKGTYKPMLWSREKVDAAMVNKLELE